MFIDVYFLLVVLLASMNYTKEILILYSANSEFINIVLKIDFIFALNIIEKITNVKLICNIILNNKRQRCTISHYSSP